MYSSGMLVVKGDLPSIFVLVVIGFLIRKFLLFILDKKIEDNDRFFILKRIITFLYITITLIVSLNIAATQDSFVRSMFIVLITGIIFFVKTKKDYQEGSY